jgi:hypothetical protein
MLEFRDKDLKTFLLSFLQEQRANPPETDRKSIEKLNIKNNNHFITKKIF